MTPEEEMVLFSVLQDIADELRRIKRGRQAPQKKESQARSEKSKTNNFSSRSFHVVDTFYTGQEV